MRREPAEGIPQPTDYELTPLSFLTSSKLRKYLKLHRFHLSYLIQFWQVLADFGKFFSHKFTHRIDTIDSDIPLPYPFFMGF